MKRILACCVLTAVLTIGCSEDDAMLDPVDSSADLALADGASGERMFEVTLENLTNSQPMSPGVVATHNGNASVFSVGDYASEGIRAIAEDGDPSVSVGELTGANGVYQVMATTAPLGRANDPNLSSTLTFQVKAAGDANLLSLAVMLICTNDGFAGVDAVPLPHGYAPKTFYSRGYDAGTELDDELYTSIVDPCGAIGPVQVQPDGENNRTPTKEVISGDHNIEGVGDLRPRYYAWRNPVLKVTVRQIPMPVTYEVTLENLTTGQPMSPGVIVTHTSRLNLFSAGQGASESIRAIAEDGDPSVGVDELSDLRVVYEVLATSAPLGRQVDQNFPSSLTTKITAAGYAKYLSVAVMLICTNDGFAGVSQLALPDDDNPVMYYSRAYDAGTEVNDELYTSIVDPCGGIGPIAVAPDGMNNRTPENGVVRVHDNIKGVGDLVPGAHGWENPVLKITVQRASN